MSADGDASAPHEIVIVRRRGGDGEDGHHGGAWKIAFADLMTAMMAFFLVMWLLNASDKEKIQQIATYFNPVKLNSKRPTEKGVEETVDVPKASKTDKAGKAEKQNQLDSEEEKKKKKSGAKGGGDGDRKEGSEKQPEEELFNDPYGVLERLAQKANEGQVKSLGIGSGREGSALPGGDSFTNPFEPFNDRPQAPLHSAIEPGPLTLDETGGAPNPAPALEEPPPPAEVQPPAETVPPRQVEEGEQGKAHARALESELMKALAALRPEDKPSLEVTNVEDGLLISLTDDFRFGMFATGSAEPNPDLVLVMDKVGKVLADQEGRIIVRGHTDARPFKSQKNSNWRLSTSRAQMAYFMLVRGGVDEKRFERIEGYADRALKVPSDPNAAQNRRIEILLKVPKA